MDQTVEKILLDLNLNEKGTLILTEKRKVHRKQLSTLLNDGPLTEAQARLIFRELLREVMHAHACNIFHRDIHLDHIFVSRNHKKIKLSGWKNSSKGVQTVSTLQHKCIPLPWGSSAAPGQSLIFSLWAEYYSQ